LATNSHLPSRLIAICSGSEPPGMTRSSLLLLTSKTPMPSAFLSAGGSVDSSTPGGAIGDPLSATYSVDWSGLTRTPRGRLPSGTVATTCFEATSITVRSPEVSLVT
jgi:hypothetical protein